MSAPEAREQAAGLVTDGDAGPLAHPCLRSRVLASLLGGWDRRLVRAQPHRIVVEPISASGTAHVRDLRPFSAPRAAGKPPRLEARALDALCARLVGVPRAKGRPEGCRRGLAQPGPLSQALGVGAMGQACDRLGEPAWCFGQGIDQGTCPWGALDLVEAPGAWSPRLAWARA
jgi:hypothetical protein